MTRLMAEPRRRGRAAPDPRRPLVLVEEAMGGPRILDLNDAAARARLKAGDRLADARALVGRLQARPADPAADARALHALALWATRYTPRVAPWGEAEGSHGLHLDVAGAEHLFGGEAALMADLARRLAGFGLRPRPACASTTGLAYGLARFGEGGARVPGGREAEALAPLPVEALRVGEVWLPLRRLGLKRVGDLLGRPRAPLARRFGEGLLRRLDQALGLEPEPLVPVVEPPAYGIGRQLAGAITAQEMVARIAADLMGALVPALERDGVGARGLRLSLYRGDGAATLLDLALAQPTRDPLHVARLVALRLERLSVGLDAGLGWEAAHLGVTCPEPMSPRQASLGKAGGPGDGDQALADRLRQRLGVDSLRRLRPHASHTPERASALRPWGDDPIPGERADEAAEEIGPRPLLLLARAEPAEVAASPAGLPLSLCWRRVLHLVAHAEGPERIAAEWWREGEATRDYWVVESRQGYRLWLYQEVGQPRWFVHGLFA